MSNDASAIEFTEQTANDNDVDPRSSESDEASDVCDKDVNVNEQDSEFSLNPSESGHGLKMHDDSYNCRSSMSWVSALVRL